MRDLYLGIGSIVISVGASEMGAAAAGTFTEQCCAVAWDRPSIDPLRHGRSDVNWQIDGSDVMGSIADRMLVIL